MKNTIFATLITIGLMMSATVFAADGKVGDASNSEKLQKPQNLNAQVIDNGNKAADAGKVELVEKEKKTDEQTKPVFHFPGHAFQ